MRFGWTMFSFLIVPTFFVLFVEAATSKSPQSNVNTFGNIYSRILNEDNLRNETQSFQNEVDYFTRNIMRKILPIIMNISSQISITENCKSSLIKYVRELVEEKGWALEMFDATSKPPSGLLGGTQSELGSFDQCLDIELLHGNGSAEFTGQYCAVEIKKLLISKFFYFEKRLENYSMDSIKRNLKIPGSQFDYSNFRLGVCIPSKCTHQDMSEISGKVAKHYQMEMRIPKCYVKEEVALKPVHIATICTVCLLFLLSIYGSIVEHRLKKTTRTAKKLSRYEEVIVCFSLFSNYRRLVSPPKKCDKFKMLTGMKTLTIGWVMLGHNYAWTNFLLTRRPKQLANVFQKLQFGLILNSWLCVEPFFIISGVLTSYSVLKHLHASRGRINVPLFIIRRYFRNLLLLLLTIGLAFFMPVVSSGPFWYAEVDAELNNCVQRWWAGLLFISNWLSMKEICISPASWYISADLQLHAVSLIFLYPLYRCPKFGLSLIVCFIGVCCVGVGVVTYIGDLPPAIQINSSDKQKMQDTIDLVHLRPFTHAGPYFVGVIVGYILYKDNDIRISKMHNLLGWLASIALALTTLYGANNIGHPHEPVLTSLFAAVHRTTFALAVAWVIFVCITGNAGLVNSLLSSSMMGLGGKLTFMVFLLHSIVFWTKKGSVRERVFLSHYNLLYEYIGSVFLTLMLALPSHLLLEAPVTRLDALLFPEKLEEKPCLRVTNAPFEENKTNSTIPSKTDDYPENLQNIYISYPSRDVSCDKSFKTVVFIKSNYIA